MTTKSSSLCQFGRVRNKKSLEKVGKSYKLQPGLIKQERDQDEIYEDAEEIGKRKKRNGWFILKKTFYQMLSVMLDVRKEWRKQQDWV